MKPTLARPPRSVPLEPKPDASCAICHTDGARFFLEGADRLFGHVPGRFRLYRCSACGCVFQHPMPESSEIPEFYPEGYWWEEMRGQAAGMGSLLGRLEKAYREFVAMDHVRFLERCARRGPAGGRELLDVGCGEGRSYTSRAGEALWRTGSMLRHRRHLWPRNNTTWMFARGT